MTIGPTIGSTFRFHHVQCLNEKRLAAVHGLRKRSHLPASRQRPATTTLRHALLIAPRKNMLLQYLETYNGIKICKSYKQIPNLFGKSQSAVCCIEDDILLQSKYLHTNAKKMSDVNTRPRHSISTGAITPVSLS